MDAVEGLIRQLQRGTTLNPGATAAELEGLGGLLGLEVPNDVRKFYSLANGMPDSIYDQHYVAFWSIEKMHTERERWGDDEVGFADVLIDSWRFIFRTSSNGLVVMSENVVPGAALEEIGTFTRFAELYIRTPRDLHLC